MSMAWPAVWAAAMDLQDVATWLGWVAAIVVALSVIGKAGKVTWDAFRRISMLADQLLGDPDARPPVPSLVERVTEIERAHIELVRELKRPPPPRHQARR